MVRFNFTNFNENLEGLLNCFLFGTGPESGTCENKSGKEPSASSLCNSRDGQGHSKSKRLQGEL